MERAELTRKLREYWDEGLTIINLELVMLPDVNLQEAMELTLAIQIRLMTLQNLATILHRNLLSEKSEITKTRAALTPRTAKKN